MKRVLINLIFFLVLFLIEVSVAGVFSETRYLVPQLLLISLIILSMYKSFEYALWLGFFFGALVEMFGGLYFGGHIFAFILTAVIIHLITRNFISQEPSPGLTVGLVIGVSLAFPFLAFIYNWSASLLGLVEINIGLFYSAGIIWTVIINTIFFFPLKAIIKSLP